METKKDKSYTYYIIGLLFLLFPIQLHAQPMPGVNDMLSLEAMIDNHKTVRTALGIRSAAELGVELAHEGSQKSISDYQETAKEVDKYKRYFDILNLILNGAATAFHGVRTYKSCQSNITAYIDLLGEYEEKILSKGAIWTSDTIIFTSSKQAIEEIKSSATGIYKSYIDLAAYLSGTAEMDTGAMMLCLQCINENMDDIDKSIKNAYMTLYSYMLVRTGFWKKEIFSAKTIEELAIEAFDSWKQAQMIAYENHKNATSKKTTFKTLGGGGILGGRNRDDNDLPNLEDSETSNK